jgi:lipopolysaccharide heptosyltransferase II
MANHNFLNRETPRIYIAGVDWLGDVLFSTPMFRAIKKAYPKSHVAVSTPSSLMPLLENNPHVDEILGLDEQPFMWGLLSHHRFMMRLKRARYDAALLLHRSSTRAFMAYRAGIPERIGFDYKKRNWMLTRIVSPPDATQHRASQYLHLLTCLGIKPDGLYPEMVLTEADHLAWRKLYRETPLFDGAPYIVFHPGGNWDLKRWPLDGFKAVAEFLRLRGIRVAVCGSESEEPLARALEDASISKHVISFCGKTTLRSLAAMIQESAAILSNDSGPIHIAASVGTPIIGIFGPTDSKITGPVTHAAHEMIQGRFGCELPCYFDRCDHRVCMQKISPQQIIAALERVLSNETLKSV